MVANKEICERQGFVVRGLPVGEKINFRVVAVNMAGRSPPATLQQPVTIREVVGESVRFIWKQLKTCFTVCFIQLCQFSFFLLIIFKYLNHTVSFIEMSPVLMGRLLLL